LGVRGDRQTLHSLGRHRREVSPLGHYRGQSSPLGRVVSALPRESSFQLSHRKSMCPTPSRYPLQTVLSTNRPVQHTQKMMVSSIRPVMRTHRIMMSSNRPVTRTQRMMTSSNRPVTRTHTHRMMMMMKGEESLTQCPQADIVWVVPNKGLYKVTSSQ